MLDSGKAKEAQARGLRGPAFRAARGPPDRLPGKCYRQPEDEGGPVEEPRQGYLKLARSCWTLGASGALGASFRNVS